MTFQEWIFNETGYECITTFWDDFAIAERFSSAQGVKKAVEETYKIAFREWKDDYKFFTELVLVLNHRCWFHYENNRMELSRLYQELYYKADEYARDHFTDEEAARYYFKVTD